MLGLNEFKDFEDCIEFIKEHNSFNSVIQIILFAGNHTIKRYFAVDRFQALFFDRYSTTDLENIFNEESFERLQIQYKLLPTKNRNYPIMCTTEVTKDMILRMKAIEMPMINKLLEAIKLEILNHLIEGYSDSK